MKVISESAAGPRGPWKATRVCSPQTYGGCGAVIEITVADIEFESEDNFRRGAFVCPCCGTVITVHVPSWATRELWMAAVKKSKAERGAKDQSINAIIEAGLAMRVAAGNVMGVSGPMADAARKWDPCDCVCHDACSWCGDVHCDGCDAESPSFMDGT